MLLLLALACAPKTPPEGSIELQVGVEGSVSPVITPVDEVAADAPVALGAGRPWSGEASTDAQRAFESGEALIAELQALPEPRGAVESSQRASRAAELAEQALGFFEISAEDPELRVPSTCRAGDAWRLSAAAMRQLQPPPHSDPAAEASARAERDESARSMEEEALRAYSRVIADRAADPLWLSHARWGVDEVEPR